MSESENKGASAKTTYLVVGAVAAVVSAATVAYLFWRRSRLAEQADSVQQLLERCNDQIHNIERRIGELNSVGQSQTVSAG